MDAKMPHFYQFFFITAFFVLMGGLALAYEEPSYSVVKTYPDFELRQYESFIIAEVHVFDEFDNAGKQAFRKLFDYISNKDRPQGKIAMTTPVIQQPLQEEHVESSGEAVVRQGYRFAFVMPAEYALADLPAPEDPDIKISEQPARFMAARRYSGTWSEKRYRDNEKILLDAIEKNNLTATGQPIFARYNAPFSLWFLRRNEVLVGVENPF